MKCQEVQHWLLTTRADAALPCAIRNHLLRCASCQRKQQLLNRIEGNLRTLPLSPADAAAKGRLLAAIKKLPQHEAPAPGSAEPATDSPIPRGLPATPLRLAPGRLRRVDARVLALATAAALLLAVGWWIGRQFGSVAPVNDPIAKQKSSADAEPALVVRLAEYDVALAARTDPAQQVQTLSDLAAELREEAVRRTQRGAVDEVPLLRDLYRRTALQGVVRHALQLPEALRTDTVAELVKQFRAAEVRLRELSAAALPLGAQMIRPLQEAARESADLLEAGKQPPPAADEPAGDRPAFASLVHLALKLAGETDPLQRANLSSEAAEVLAQSAVALSAAGQPEQAGLAGRCLSDLLERGVASNLDRVDTKNKEANRLAVQKIRQRTTQTVALLEQNLQGASAATRAGLEQALQAARPGHDAVVQPGKGQGPVVLPGP